MINPFQLSGSAKVKDALFLGDIATLSDIEFLNFNRITNIVNTASEIPNIYEQFGIQFYNLNWKKGPSQRLYESLQLMEECHQFIDQAIKKGESVMIVSLKGNRRVGCCLTLYLIDRFKWGLNMTLQFVSNKRPHFIPNRSTRKKMEALINELMRYVKGPKTYKWGVLADEKNEEERIMHFTFMNTAIQIDVCLSIMKGIEE